MNRRQLLAAAAAPFVLGTVPPASGRTGGGTALALVTADLEASIVAVDLTSGDVHSRLETPTGPRSIESIGGTGGVVAHTAFGRVTVVDSRLRVRPVSGDFGAPRYTAVSPDRSLAYVTDSELRLVQVVELAERRVVGRAQVGGPGRPPGLDPPGRLCSQC